MASYSDPTPEQQVKDDIDRTVIEALDLGLDPIDINRLVEESIAWAIKELEKEEFEA
jgi:hypothetical protein